MESVLRCATVTSSIYVCLRLSLGAVAGEWGHGGAKGAKSTKPSGDAVASLHLAA